MYEPELMIEECKPLPGEEPGPDDTVMQFPMSQIIKEDTRMEERLTIKQVLEITVGMLEDINVPMKHIDDIGIPIAKSIKNLKVCISAQEEADKQAAEKEKEKADVIELPVSGECSAN